MIISLIRRVLSHKNAPDSKLAILTDRLCHLSVSIALLARPLFLGNGVPPMLQQAPIPPASCQKGHRLAQCYAYFPLGNGVVVLKNLIERGGRRIFHGTRRLTYHDLHQKRPGSSDIRDSLVRSVLYDVPVNSRLGHDRISPTHVCNLPSPLNAKKIHSYNLSNSDPTLGDASNAHLPTSYVSASTTSYLHWSSAT